MDNKHLKEKVVPLEVDPNRTIADLITSMANTGYQGRKLAEASQLYYDMLNEENLTIILGYSASLSVAGQWKMITWLLEMNYVDVLVVTGANISEDLVNSLGYAYYKGEENINDEELFKLGVNRYYDILGREKDYLEMTELISVFISTLESDYQYTTREFLYKFGEWLNSRNIYSIVSVAAKKKIPIYCPALTDSPYGDATLIAKSKGVDLIIDSAKDYIEFMNLAKYINQSGVFYIGGGVPKDFIQLLAVTPDLLFEERKLPNRVDGRKRAETNESYYPHKYAIQLTTDSPQWGGLSGCTFNEAISWGKEKNNGKHVQCFCDATIALPIIIHFVSQKKQNKRDGTYFSKLF